MASPGVWVMLLAIMALLVGLCVWGIFGRVDKVSVQADGTTASESVAPMVFVTN